MAGVHGLKHVQGLAAADLADDDPVRPHTQRVADQVANSHLAAPFGVGGAGLQTHHMRLLQRELGGVLNGDNAFALRDRAGQGVEEGGLTRTGSPRDEDVEPCCHQGAEQVRGLLRQAAARDKIREAKGLGETADRDRRSVEAG